MKSLQNQTTQESSWAGGRQDTMKSWGKGTRAKDGQIKRVVVKRQEGGQGRFNVLSTGVQVFQGRGGLESVVASHFRNYIQGESHLIQSGEANAGGPRGRLIGDLSVRGKKGVEGGSGILRVTGISHDSGMFQKSQNKWGAERKKVMTNGGGEKAI